MRAGLSLVILLASAHAFAAEPSETEPPPEKPIWGEPPQLPGDEHEDDEAVVEESPDEKSDSERLGEVEDELVEVRQRLDQVEQASLRSNPLSFFGYVDFGFFLPEGNGVGWIQDFGNAAVPSLAGQYGWVFLGDILSTAVNSRGEAADLGEAPGELRFDSVDSRGAPGFLLNEVNFGVKVDLGYRAVLSTSVNFVPRTGSNFSLGDFFNVDLAQVEWAVTDSQKTSLFVGKMEPVIGIEYRDRRADERFGITPSLIQRYNSGTQLGVKVRSKLLDDWLIVAAAVTNGSSTTEQFHFYNEVDSNSGKNLSGRVAVAVPVESVWKERIGDSFEVGVSGEFGSQDRALDNDGNIWFVGADLAYRAADYALKVEWLKGKAPGRPIDDVYALDLKNSGYVEVNYRIIPELGLLLRGGLRDAFVSLGTERAYLTKSWRLTAGVRCDINQHIIIKAEYLHNGEFGDVPEFGNDIATSSLILRY